MLTVQYFPKGDAFDPFVTIESPTCAPVGDDDPLIIEDPSAVRKLIADLQEALTKWEREAARP